MKKRRKNVKKSKLSFFKALYPNQYNKKELTDKYECIAVLYRNQRVQKINIVNSLKYSATHFGIPEDLILKEGFPETTFYRFTEFTEKA